MAEIEGLRTDLQTALAANNQSSSSSPAVQAEKKPEDLMELALQPLFEKIQDETDEVYFQDANGRILKIILWAEAGQQAVDLEELH